jgi:hypothetical protein
LPFGSPGDFNRNSRILIKHSGSCLSRAWESLATSDIAIIAVGRLPSFAQ